LHKWLGALIFAVAVWLLIIYYPNVVRQVMWWLLVILGFLALSVLVIYELTKNSYLRQVGFDRVDQMDGVSFERHLQALFRGLGYSVGTTPASGDFGADLVISKDRVRAVVQAKRSSKSVGVRAVQEALGAARIYGCEKSIVVTNCHFTGQAQQLAQANGVELWDREVLKVKMLALVPNSTWREFVSAVGPILEALFVITAIVLTLYFVVQGIIVVMGLWLLCIAFKAHKS